MILVNGELIRYIDHDVYGIDKILPSLQIILTHPN